MVQSATLKSIVAKTETSVKVGFAKIINQAIDSGSTGIDKFLLKDFYVIHYELVFTQFF